jgi:ABC-type long-subunit fatty acid transport system fused permease/ATPase subunit
MTTDELKNYFVTGYRFKLKTGMAINTFQNWMKWGYVPMDAQCRIEEFTRGELKADFEHARRRRD